MGFEFVPVIIALDMFTTSSQEASVPIWMIMINFKVNTNKAFLEMVYARDSEAGRRCPLEHRMLS